MKCLSCNSEMMNYEVHTISQHISYDVCESCGGLWLDKGALDKMAFQVDGDIEYCSKEEVDGPGSTKHCPRCAGESLHKVLFLGHYLKDGIILERCENCNGFWLDGGQLDKIDAALARIMPVKGEGFSVFITNTHLPHYYRRIRRDSAETDFSIPPALPVKHSKFVGKTSHKCPTCEKLLDLHKAYGIAFESCSKCGGLWVHQKELRVLKAKVDEDSWGNLRWMNDELAAIERTSAIVSNKSCPECAESHLLSTHFGNSNIIIDWCNHCHGVWLERHEFEDIVRYLRDELDHLTSREMENKVIEQVKRLWTDSSESKISEVLDAKAAMSALINISIFEHPALADSLIRGGRAAARIVPP